MSSSHDKSLRLWERTEEPLVLQEEREMEREKEFEESIGQGGEQTVVRYKTTKPIKEQGSYLFPIHFTL